MRSPGSVVVSALVCRGEGWGIKLEKAWRTFRARRHFVIKPKKLTLSPNLNPNPSPNLKHNLNPNPNL